MHYFDLHVNQLIYWLELRSMFDAQSRCKIYLVLYDFLEAYIPEPEAGYTEKVLKFSGEAPILSSEYI